VTELDLFLEERNAALRSLNIEWARKQSPNLPESSLLMALHKVRYECIDMPDELRQQSRAWLEVRKLGRMYGMGFSADGSLPVGANSPAGSR
jgi:hypothetical protein